MDFHTLYYLLAHRWEWEVSLLTTVRLNLLINRLTACVDLGRKLLALRLRHVGLRCLAD